LFAFLPRKKTLFSGKKKMQVKKKKKEKGLRERVEEEEKCEGK